MKQVSQRAEEYLGRTLFRLYKEKHPAIKLDSNVVEISRDNAMWGFRVRVYESRSTESLTLPLDKIEIPKFEDKRINPEQFETWAESKDSRFFRMAFDERLNTLYVATLNEERSR